MFRRGQRLPLAIPSCSFRRLCMAKPSSARRREFTLLSRDYDFGSIDGISWRGDFHEGNNPLRRMNLAYMGYAVPLLAGGDPGSLQAVRKILSSLVAQNAWSETGVFRDVWNTYTASHRMINLLSGLALYRKTGGPVDADARGRFSSTPASAPPLFAPILNATCSSII